MPNYRWFEMKLLGIYGASGFGREVIGMLPESYGRADEIVFIDDACPSSRINGYRRLTWEDFCEEPADSREVVLAIADSRIRQVLAGKCSTAGVSFFQAQAENVVVLDAVEIGEGAILCPFSMITSNVRIGVHFHCNIYSYVAHDCVIGDYVTFAPGVKCNGNIRIEDHAYIGTGAVLRQGKPGDPLVIGEGAVIGMGAVVTKSVPAGATVVGNPARPLER